MNYTDLGYDFLGTKRLLSNTRSTVQEARSSFQFGALTANSAFIGSGDKVFKADKEGIYLGNAVFADAPFSVDMEGNMVASSATMSSYVAKAGTGQTLSGNLAVGEGNVLIDGVNKRITINDGTNDIVLLGYDSGGF